MTTIAYSVVDENLRLIDTVLGRCLLGTISECPGGVSVSRTDIGLRLSPTAEVPVRYLVVLSNSNYGFSSLTEITRIKAIPFLLTAMRDVGIPVLVAEDDVILCHGPGYLATGLARSVVVPDPEVLERIAPDLVSERFSGLFASLAKGGE